MPPRHDWDGIETYYVHWLVFPVGPLAESLRRRPAPFVKLAWQLSSRRFLAIAGSFSPNIIFAHHAQFSGFVAARLARQLKIPYFISEHNFSDLESCANNQRRKRHYLEAIDGIGAWIAVAKRMSATMRDIFPRVPTATVPNGADAIPDEFRWLPRPPAAVGAAAHRSQIRLLRRLPHSDVLQHMAWCDLFANLGIDEAYGVVFAEAMRAGKPIIYATDCGITDVVTDGVHGFGVTPGDGDSASAASGAN